MTAHNARRISVTGWIIIPILIVTYFACHPRQQNQKCTGISEVWNDSTGLVIVLDSPNGIKCRYIDSTRIIKR